MKTIKKNGSESTEENNSQVDIDNQIIDSRIDEQLQEDEDDEESYGYCAFVEDKFEQMKNDVMEIFTDDVFEAFMGFDASDIIDEDMSEKEIEDHYYDLLEQFCMMVWENIHIPQKIIDMHIKPYRP
jgi:hypothetical protein